MPSALFTAADERRVHAGGDRRRGGCGRDHRALPQLFAERQGVATKGLVTLAGVDGEQLLQHIRRRAIGHQRGEVSLQLIELGRRLAVQRPVNTALDPVAGDAAEPRQPNGHLAEQRCDPMLPVILHVTGAAAGAAAWPPDRMGPAWAATTSR